MNTKRCSKCGRVRKLSCFHKDCTAFDGYYYQCKTCKKQARQEQRKKPKALKKEAKARRKWRANNLGQSHKIERKSYLKYKWDMSLTDYDELFARQVGCCGICGKPQSDYQSRFHIDHDHETGKIRGLLCYSCNVKLGWYEKKKESLLKYLSYSTAGDIA